MPEAVEACMHLLTKALFSSLSSLKSMGFGCRQYLLSTSMARTSVVLLGLLSWNRSPPKSTKSTCTNRWVSRQC